MYEIDKLASAWKGHRQFAEWLVSRINPNTIVDLGVDYGYSTFCFANPNIGTVYGIDTFEGDQYTGIHTDAEQTVNNVIKENGYNNIEIIKGKFDDIVKSWDKPIDILHIDGLHTYHDTLNNYEKWSKFLHKDSVLLMHDTVSFEPVQVVYNRIKMNKCMFKHSQGLGVFSENESLINEIKEKYAI